MSFYKLRHGLSDEFLQILFQCSTRQAASLIVVIVRQSLMLRCVRNSIGFKEITRENNIQTCSDQSTSYSYY